MEKQFAIHDRFSEVQNRPTVLPNLKPLKEIGVHVAFIYYGESIWTILQWTGKTGCYLQMNRLSLRNNQLKFNTAR